MIRCAPLLFGAALLACGDKTAKAPRPAPAPTRVTATTPAPLTCAGQLLALDDVRLGPQLDPKAESAIVRALATCEQALVKTLSPGDRDELAKGRSLYALSLAGSNDDELYAYAGLLHRFALATEMRRVLHFGPPLARLFGLRPAAGGVCSLAAREAALFFALTPKSMGGDAPKGSSYFSDALRRRPACSRDFLLAAEIARMSLDVPAALALTALVNALSADDLVDRDRAVALKSGVKDRLQTLLR